MITPACRTDKLLSNAHGAKLAEEFKLAHWSGKPCFGKGSCSSDAAADAWEAHLGALYLANGRQAVLDFLVPLVKRDFLKRSKSTSTAPPVLKLGTDTTSPVDLALRPVAVDPSSARVVDPPSALIANPASASVVDPLSAPGALPPSAPVVEAPSAAAVDPTVAIDSWQSAFAAAETSPVPRPLRKSPKGSLKKSASASSCSPLFLVEALMLFCAEPLVYRSHKLAIENVLADLTERGVDFLMLKAKRVYRFRVAGGPELVAKRTLQEPDRVGSFVSQLVKAGLVQISKCVRPFLSPRPFLHQVPLLTLLTTPTHAGSRPNRPPSRRRRPDPPLALRLHAFHSRSSLSSCPPH